jgi:hypothetical protein
MMLGDQAGQGEFSSTAGNTRQCQSWRSRIYARHPAISYHLEKQHTKIATKSGYVPANQWLSNQEKALKIGKSGLFCDSDDQEIKDYAEAKSRKTEKQLQEAYQLIGTKTQAAKDQLNTYLRGIVETAGLEYPLPEDNYTSRDMVAALARICDPAWWRKQLRKTVSRQYEQLARSTGGVSLSGGIYCSDYTLKRRQEAKRRNRRLLESLEAENSQGQIYTLAELADLSTSNPINRRNELMVRIAGFEEYAKTHHHTAASSDSHIRYMGLFLTLTTPSKYHAMKAASSNNGSRYAYPNPKYNGSTPREANNYLCDIWAQIRSEWDRREIHPFGFRMAEPHHDGTPHWHMILFIPENQLIEISYVFNHYALREDGDEYGASEYRSKIVYIDPTKGSAAGYCAKYVAKNIDGFAVDADLYGRDAIKSAMRIEAWASTWGIRQFQQIGGPSVTVWREARRIGEGLVDVTLSPEAGAIIEAADAGDWETYTDLMGGAICPREDRPLRPMMVVRPTHNRYGEFPELLKGLLNGLNPIVTRIETWSIRPATTKTEDQSNWASALNSFYTEQPQAA